MRFRWLIALALIALLVAFVVPPVYRIRAYHNEARRIREAISSLEDRSPQGISPDAWQQGVRWTVTAHCNVCFSPEHTSFEALTRFGRQLDEEVAGGVDAGLIEWTWDRLAETGPTGVTYTERFRPSLRESMQWAASAPAVAK